jgi:hypothetical protein
VDVHCWLNGSKPWLVALAVAASRLEKGPDSPSPKRHFHVPSAEQMNSHLLRGASAGIGGFLHGDV